MGFWGKLFRRIRKALMPVTRLIQATIEYSIDKLTAAGRALINYACDHPWEFGITSILIVGGVLVIVVPLAIGFGSAGPTLGSTAAAWQSSIGNVQAGSLFSILQSLTMRGVHYYTGAAMITVGCLVPIVRYYWRKWFGGGGDGNKPGGTPP